MADQLTRIRVFVGAPQGLAAERQKLRETLDEINLGIADHKALVLQYVNWEPALIPAIKDGTLTDLPPSTEPIGPRDLFIGILWRRFGAPAFQVGTGTQEEFDQAYQLFTRAPHPKLRFYFNTQPFFPETVYEAQQLADVLAFRERVGDLGSVYHGVEEFADQIRGDLIEEIWDIGSHEHNKTPDLATGLSVAFYKALFRDLDDYITHFEQLARDYERENRGKKPSFAIDFSELYNYMYPGSRQVTRPEITQYVVEHLDDPFTLMPGAAGELLTNISHELSINKIQNPLISHESVVEFVNQFPYIMDNEERVLELYGLAEPHLRTLWGHLFDFVVQGRQPGYEAVKQLIDRQRLAPIDGLAHLQEQARPLEFAKYVQRVRNDLNYSRPELTRNNLVDTLDFATTWLLSRLEKERRNRYLAIYTQSKSFVRACTRLELQWENDYLVRGALYFKIRTKLQEYKPIPAERQQFVSTWTANCKWMQREIRNLADLESEAPRLSKPSLQLLNMYQKWDEECRQPLSFAIQAPPAKKRANRLREAQKLYSALKRGVDLNWEDVETLDLLKVYLRDIQKRVKPFHPENYPDPESQSYIQLILKWLGIEDTRETET